MTPQEKYEQALKYLYSGNYEEATLLFEEAEKNGVFHAKLYLAKMISQEKPERAITLCEEYHKGEPDNVEAVFIICKLYCEWGKPYWNPEKGRNFLEKLENLRSTYGRKLEFSFFHYLELGEIYANSYMRRDREDYGKHDINDVRKAKEYYELAIEKCKENENVPQELLDIVIQQLNNQIKRIEAYEAAGRSKDELVRSLGDLIELFEEED
jgi:tetratricopeptide (TPR) repeat protein